MRVRQRWLRRILAVLLAWAGLAEARAGARVGTGQVGIGQFETGQVGNGVEAQPMVTSAVDDSIRVTLRGNVSPQARPENDLGAVEDSFAAGRLVLILKRPGARQRALEQFLSDARTPGSASYHRWLTPEEFGQRFGAADSDVSAVAAWLESHGLTVNKVHPGRIAMEFSGNAGQLKEAFRTEIHRYSLRTGGIGYANASEPRIPAALAGVVAGIAPMTSFRARPAIRIVGRASYDARTHQAAPEWTFPESSAGMTYELGPADFAVQYDLGPVYASGVTGAGQSIGILSDSNVDLSLVRAYQTLFGLAGSVPAVVVDGNDPSQDGGQNVDATEAYLDLEEAGAVAPGAQVVMYTSAGSVLTDPLLSAGLRAVEDNVVSVMSASYEVCEAELGAAGNAAWAALWQEAAAQGITVFVAAGDGGSAGCDDFDTESFAESGLAVNGLGSTPYNVAVGGTDFYFSDYAASASTLDGQIATYWSATASAKPAVSLLQPAPEQVWNEAFGLNASDGGLYSAAASTILAGGGGASSAALYPATGPIGYRKPGWQTGVGVPADEARDVPDVSLFAAGGSNFVEYPICAVPGDCGNTTSGGTVQVTSVGGTSAAAPAMAAIQALVDQATKSRQGQAAAVYYALAGKTLTAKPFRDITVGGNSVPCFAGTANCVPGTSGPATGNYAESGYAATTGYDRASGLGSVDAANLIANWPAAAFQASATTLSLSPTTFPHGTAVTVTASVAPASGTGSPTGSVALTGTDAVSYGSGLGLLNLANGTAKSTLDNLPGGTYQVLGDYSGDGTYAASASTPVTVTVTPEADTLRTSGWVVNPVDGNLYPLQAGMSIPYGSEVYLDAQPAGVNEAAVALGQTTPATGAVTFTDVVGTGSRSAAVPLNSAGMAEWFQPALAVGSHTIGASYTGDASYGASTAATAASLTVFKGTTTIFPQPLETSVAAGSAVTVDLEIYADVLPLNGLLPTGTVSVTLGGQTQTIASPFRSWGTAGGAVEEVVATFASVPAGILPLSASYSGDGNWFGSSALSGSVESLAAKPAPSLTLTSAATSYAPNQAVTLSGTVTGTTALGAPKGSVLVTWEDGGSSQVAALQTAAATSAAWTLSLPAWKMANGANTFVATFAGDTNYSAQSSAPLTVTLNGSDFSLTTTTQEVGITPATTGMGTVEVTPLNGYSGTVAITCSAPAAITCSAATASPTVGAGVSDAINISVTGTVAGGRYPAIVTATGGGHTHTAQILIVYMPITAAPTFSPGGGTYSAEQTVTMSDVTPGAAIYYTKDGSTPTSASTVYAGPIAVNSTETLKAVAMAPFDSLSVVASASYTISTTAVATPTFSIPGGKYYAQQTVSLTDATSGTTMYYTLNGTTPTTKSTKYSAPLLVSGSGTLQAIAYGSSGAASAVASETFAMVVAPPVFTPPSGTYAGPLTVTISSPTSTAKLDYTPNGNTPSVFAAYTGPISLAASGKVYALGQETGFTQSATSEAIYTIEPAAATPVFSLASGAYSGAQTVTFSDATTSATMYYTTNGMAPTTASTVYSGPISVSATETLSAIAVAAGYANSAVASATYTINPSSQAATPPVFSIPGGTYEAQPTVTITDVNPGATIYYTANGLTPTAKSTVYSKPLSIGVSSTLQAIAYANGVASPVASETFTLVAAAPVFDPPSGSYPAPLTVTITSATPTAKIAYTPNGSIPSEFAAYTGPITLTASGKIYALAQETGFTSSPTVETAYTLQPAAATPALSVAAGNCNSTLTVTMADSTAGAMIYYTTNGNEPTVASAKYAGPVTVTAHEVLKAVAIARGYSPSTVGTAGCLRTSP